MPTPTGMPPTPGPLLHRAAGESLAERPALDARPAPGAAPPEARRLARTAGMALAVGALLTAFAASAQTAVYGPDAESNGVLPWVFALFVAAAVVGVFLVVLALFRAPGRRDRDDLPGAARRR